MQSVTQEFARFNENAKNGRIWWLIEVGASAGFVTSKPICIPSLVDRTPARCLTHLKSPTPSAGADPGLDRESRDPKTPPVPFLWLIGTNLFEKFNLGSRRNKTRVRLAQKLPVLAGEKFFTKNHCEFRNLKESHKQRVGKLSDWGISPKILKSLPIYFPHSGPHMILILFGTIWAKLKTFSFSHFA